MGNIPHHQSGRWKVIEYDKQNKEDFDNDKPPLSRIYRKPFLKIKPHRLRSEKQDQRLMSAIFISDKDIQLNSRRKIIKVKIEIIK